MANTQYLLARDTVMGAEGSAFLTDEDGKQHLLFMLKNISTSADIQSEDMKVVGTRIIQEKAAGAKLSGTATLYYCTDYFLDMVLEYIHTGRMPYFDLQITNNDPTTTIGTRVMAYYRCKLSGEIPLSKLDAETSMLDVEISFSVGDVQKLEGFADPAQLGS